MFFNKKELIFALTEVENPRYTNCQMLIVFRGSPFVGSMISCLDLMSTFSSGNKRIAYALMYMLLRKHFLRRKDGVWLIKCLELPQVFLPILQRGMPSVHSKRKPDILK
jgi:hypothetical protein